MSLHDITRSGVLAALHECDELGREAFLAKYGFGPARQWVLLHDGREYDSKAIAGVAHGYDPPGSRPLRPQDFSGGAATVAATLRGLDFEVVNTAEPPVGADRLVKEVARLRTARAKSGPMLKQAVVLLWAVGRAAHRRPRLTSWAEFTGELTPLLARFRREGEGPAGRPDYPVAALYRAGLWELRGHGGNVPTARGDAAVSRWFADRRPEGGLADWADRPLRESAGARLAAIDAVVTRFELGDAEYAPLLAAVELDVGVDTAEEPLPGSGEQRRTDYRILCGLVTRFEARDDGRRRTAVSHDPVRSRSARRAVLTRSGGHCENPACGKEAPDLTDSGAPILEVDHVVELAGGGRDHPQQMVALCPDCHAVKTRGRSRDALTVSLLEEALRLHQAMLRAVDAME